jgi:hypothetical protein
VARREASSAPPSHQGGKRNRLAVCSVRRLPAAAKAEDWEAVRQMLREYGAAIINSVDMGGCSIIHWAIRHGNTEFAKVRLPATDGSQTARPGRECAMGTPFGLLVNAARVGGADAAGGACGGFGWGGGGAQELICDPKYAQVLDINMADANGLSPVMLCVKYERTKLLYYLLEAGADFEQPNHEGMTVLTLLDRWMSERGADLRLEKEVINHAIERVRARPLVKLGTAPVGRNHLATYRLTRWWRRWE